MWASDPIDAFHQHEAAQERWLRSRPVCVECGEHIQDEYAFYIDGEWICEDCMHDNFRRAIPET